MEIGSAPNKGSFRGFKGQTVQEIFKESVNEAESHKLNQLPGAVSELTDSLFLCSAFSVNPAILEALEVTCVVNVAPELPNTPLHRDDIIYRRIEIIDSGSSRIHDYFDETADLIQEVANSGGRTMVYCVAGVSRSASLCLAYLMKHQGMTLLEAYNFVKIRRPKIRPNCGFFKQLIDYELELFGTNSVKMVFNELVRMEIPDVYDSEYRFVQCIGKKGRNDRCKLI